MSSQPKPIPELETERLLLRPLTAEDSPELFGLYSDEAVTRFIDIDPMQDVDQARRQVETFNALFEGGRGFRWGVFELEEQRLIGTCGFHDWDHQRARAELSYDLAKRHWGQGYMREALQAAITFGFASMNLNRIEALVDPTDTRSKNLLFGLGFTLEGLLKDHDFLKGQYQDDLVFALLKAEWVKED